MSELNDTWKREGDKEALKVRMFLNDKEKTNKTNFLEER